MNNNNDDNVFVPTSLHQLFSKMFTNNGELWSCEDLMICKALCHNNNNNNNQKCEQLLLELKPLETCRP